MPTREVIVLIPGFMCDQRVFAPQLAAFSQQYTVVVADITGSDSIEALAESGDFEGALELINEIRLRRNIEEATIEPSKVAYENFILEERARELVGEGKYWFDLIRIGQRDNCSRKEIVIENLVLNASAAEASGLRVKFQDPNSWYLPINKTELQNNTKLVQNPYYL